MNGRPEEAGEQPAPAPEPGGDAARGPVAVTEEIPPARGAMPPGDVVPPAAGATVIGEPESTNQDDAAAIAGATAEASGTAGEGSAAEPGEPSMATSPGTSADEATSPDGAPAVAPAQDSADETDPALLAEGVRIAEALIFASDRPVTSAILANVLPEGLSPATVAAALAAVCEGRGVVLTEVAGGWAFRTAPDLAQRLTKVVQAPRRLPRAAMEALSVIAYHQPCTRGEIEEIRGASLAQTTLEALLELGLIAPRGRREVPGRPTLWGTTPKFLEQFGLKALSDLPRKEELVTAETGPALPLPGVAARPGQISAPAEPPPAELAAEVEPDEEPRPSESGDDAPASPLVPPPVEPESDEGDASRAAEDDAPAPAPADTPPGSAS